MDAEYIQCNVDYALNETLTYLSRYTYRLALACLVGTICPPRALRPAAPMPREPEAGPGRGARAAAVRSVGSQERDRCDWFPFPSPAGVKHP